MNEFFSFLQTSNFSILLLVSVIILFILMIITVISLLKMKSQYKKLMELFGKGQDFNEILNNYIKEVEDVSSETLKLKNRTVNVEKNLEKCVQKVGIVRYNAYMGTGSDLCFALALLDFEDNGVVINGIYSRDNTTMTYAKPIEHGESKYTLVDEEKKAIELAKHNGYKCYLDLK